MSWILFSLLTALIFSLVSIFDKYIVTRLVKKPILLVLVMGVVGLGVSLIILFCRGLPSLPLKLVIICFAAGIFYTLVNIFYFEAIKTQEISKAVPLLYLNTLFVAFLSIIFLGEKLNLLRYIGVFMLVLGAILISINKKGQLDFKKQFWLMILSAFCLALSALLTKYLLKDIDTWTVFALSRIGSFIFLIPIYYI